MNKQKQGMNKQGIRTFDHIKGPSKGRVLEMPPDMIKTECDHKVTRVDGDGDAFCARCNAPLF